MAVSHPPMEESGGKWRRHVLRQWASRLACRICACRWREGGYHGLYIEMKKRVGGRLSQDQKDWADGLHANGYCVCRCDGWNEAVAVLEGYLRGNTKKEAGE